jgi:hypothetical protein
MTKKGQKGGGPKGAKMAKKGKKGQKTGFWGSQAKGGQKGGTRDMWGRKITIPDFWYFARFLPPPQKKNFSIFRNFRFFRFFNPQNGGVKKGGPKTETGRGLVP